jgi:DNA-binding response OmpR family regulator
MLTSVQQESDIVRGFGLGADDYIVKPFNPMELLARIKRLVRKQ